MVPVIPMFGTQQSKK